MRAKTIVITGASSGVGAAAAKLMAAQGWDVAVVGRNPERTKKVASAVGGTPFLADYDRFDDVRQLAADLLGRYDRIDVLANNAGGLVSKRGETADGHDQTLQHNHLAPFLLTNLLLPRLVESSARVIGTSSFANTFGFLQLGDLEFRKRPWLGGWIQYGTTKLMAILFARELSRRTSLEAYSFHPGYVNTRFGADNWLVKLADLVKPGGLGIPVESGAAPLVHLATVADVGWPPGTYFSRLKPNGLTSPLARDPELAAGLWDRSAAMVGIEHPAKT